eukprot:1152132-Pelagomonas_calceolata.AAC.2
MKRTTLQYRTGILYNQKYAVRFKNSTNLLCTLQTIVNSTTHSSRDLRLPKSYPQHVTGGFRGTGRAEVDTRKRRVRASRGTADNPPNPH